MDYDDSRAVEVILPNGAMALVSAIDVDGGGATGDMMALTAVDRIVAEAFRPHDARNMAAARA